MLRVLVLAGVVGWGVTGCVSSKTRCLYDAGNLKYSMTRTTIVGGGYTDISVKVCKTMIFKTEGTGVTDNGVELAGVIAEGVAKGAVGALVPIP